MPLNGKLITDVSSMIYFILTMFDFAIIFSYIIIDGIFIFHLCSVKNISHTNILTKTQHFFKI